MPCSCCDAGAAACIFTSLVGQHEPSGAAVAAHPHLPAADRQRLWAFALALHRTQRRLRIFLPAELAQRILSLFDA